MLIRTSILLQLGCCGLGAYAAATPKKVNEQSGWQLRDTAAIASPSNGNHPSSSTSQTSYETSQRAMTALASGIPSLRSHGGHPYNTEASKSTARTNSNSVQSHFPPIPLGSLASSTASTSPQCATSGILSGIATVLGSRIEGVGSAKNMPTDALQSSHSSPVSGLTSLRFSPDSASAQSSPIMSSKSVLVMSSSLSTDLKDASTSDLEADGSSWATAGVTTSLPSTTSIDEGSIPSASPAPLTSSVTFGVFSSSSNQPPRSITSPTSQETRLPQSSIIDAFSSNPSLTATTILAGGQSQAYMKGFLSDMSAFSGTTTITTEYKTINTDGVMGATSGPVVVGPGVSIGEASAVLVALMALVASVDKERARMSLAILSPWENKKGNKDKTEDSKDDDGREDDADDEDDGDDEEEQKSNEKTQQDKTHHSTSQAQTSTSVSSTTSSTHVSSTFATSTTSFTSSSIGPSCDVPPEVILPPESTELDPLRPQLTSVVVSGFPVAFISNTTAYGQPTLAISSRSASAGPDPSLSSKQPLPAISSSFATSTSSTESKASTFSSSISTTVSLQVNPSPPQLEDPLSRPIFAPKDPPSPPSCDPAPEAEYKDVSKDDLFTAVAEFCYKHRDRTIDASSLAVSYTLTELDVLLST
ncbi:MAG: hypothetical protein Q9209_004381 [Squamulea sp. 1 TL-2023]